jgi:hypothetical protein
MIYGAAIFSLRLSGSATGIGRNTTERPVAALDKLEFAFSLYRLLSYITNKFVTIAFWYSIIGVVSSGQREEGFERQ